MTAGLIETTAGELTHERTEAARHIIVESALLGVMADAVLRNAPDGLGWTAWVIALTYAAAGVARRRGLGVTREQRLWLGAAIACALAFAWRDAEELRAYNVLGTLVALTMFSMSVAGSPATSIFTARLRDVVTAGFYSVLDILTGGLRVLAGDARLETLSVIRGGASWTAVRALLLTAPLVIVFAALLSRADPVFATALALPQVDMERVLSHVLLAGMFALFAAGWMRGGMLGAGSRSALPDRVPFRLGSAEITTALGSVIGLFTVFVALQVRWLFGGADVVLATTGLTLAEYARRGFFELVGVAGLVLPLILITRALIDDEQVERRHRQFSFVLLALLVAIVASALLRMQLYVEHYGLTTDRLYATALMIWFGVVCAAMAATVLRGWARPFAAMTVITGFALLATLNALNPEALVARVNLARAQAGSSIDYAYLARLNGDAVPIVVNALNAAAPSAESCDAARSLHKRWRNQSSSWNLGAYRGSEAVRNQLPPSSMLRLCS